MSVMITLEAPKRPWILGALTPRNTALRNAPRECFPVRFTCGVKQFSVPVWMRAFPKLRSQRQPARAQAMHFPVIAESKALAIRTKAVRINMLVEKERLRRNASVQTKVVSAKRPDPNHPVPGTCTVHASSVDLSVLLAGSPGIPKPPTGPVFLPTPNHSQSLTIATSTPGPSGGKSGPFW